MKKFYVYNEAAAELEAVYFDFDGNFENILGVEYIQETGGGPVTDNDQDISLCDLMALKISEITDCDEKDEEYITGLREAWGLI